MPSIVEQIQRDALDPAIPVSSLLRRVKLAAAKLALGDVETWVERELNGYNGKVPDYRILTGSPKALNPYVGWIPLSGAGVVDISQKGVGQSIASLEDLLVGATGDSRTMVIRMPQFVQDTFARNNDGAEFVCSLHVDRSQLASVLDRVRSMVLDWAIELERAGVVGSEFSFSNEERRRAQEANVTNINVHNSGSIVGNLGSGNVARDITAGEITVDFAREMVRQVRQHQAEIAKAGVDASDLDRRLAAVEQAVAEDARPGLLRELLTDLRNTVSGAAGNVVATGVLATLAPYVGAAAG